MFGNSRTMRMNGSLEMRRATRRSLARTVALRGTLHRIPISPTISLAPSVARITGPAGVSAMTSASPVDDQIGGVGGVALRAQQLAGVERRPARS